MLRDDPTSDWNDRGEKLFMAFSMGRSFVLSGGTNQGDSESSCHDVSGVTCHDSSARFATMALRGLATDSLKDLLRPL